MIFLKHTFEITFYFKMLNYELQLLNQSILLAFDNIFNFYFHDF